MVTGYGINRAWLHEYEYLLKRPLKKFTVVEPPVVERFEVGQIKMDINHNLMNSEKRNRTRSL